MWLGAVRAGAVPAVLPDLYKARALLYFLRDTAARLCFIDAEQLGKLAEIADELPPSLQIVIVRGEPPPLGPRASRPHFFAPANTAGETPALPGGGGEGTASLAGRQLLPFAAIRDGTAFAAP